jgi:hypothetical protein
MVKLAQAQGGTAPPIVTSENVDNDRLQQPVKLIKKALVARKHGLLL